MGSMDKWLDETVMIPDLLRSHPGVRLILDRYGLHGCGGPYGPAESIEFFAKAHDVPLEQLLQELQAAAASADDRQATTTDEALADTIYRPFFKTAIAVMLTLGASWGAYLLVRIAMVGKFTAIRFHDVNAHGHAQIFGWVGLFVMGFAYQAFPRFKHSTLPHPRLAHATLWMMGVGIVLRSVLEPVAAALPAIRAIPVIATGVETFAIGLFAWLIGKMLRRSGKGLAFYDYYILSSLAWFAIQAVYETVFLARTLWAPTHEDLLWLVATWQAPLREIQIHGFAMLMILGVSQRVFHNFYGLRMPNPRKSLGSLIALNAAILGEATGFVLMRTSGHAWAMLWYGASVVLAITVFVLVSDWRIFQPAKEPDRSLKFLRTAYVWLFMSLGMLVLLPVYQWGALAAWAPASEAARMGFSHAYYGAIRHAITVGFISLMIVGVSSKVIATLNGLDISRLSRLWAPFVLINAGCSLRVLFQTLTDFTPSAFPVAGASGLLEVTGLLLWAVHVWKIMSGRITQDEPAEAPRRGLSKEMEIEAFHTVAEVLDAHPALIGTFESFGFTLIRNPFFRRTIAHRVTLESACRKMSVDLQRFLETLNRERAGKNS